MTEAYEPDNIFAQILRDELPSTRVYEDDHAIAIMDVMPQGPGHTLVIPRAASRNLLDADPATFAGVMAVIQKVARAVKEAFDADGVTVMQFNEPASGQSVFHLHFHVIPAHRGDSAEAAPRRHGRPHPARRARGQDQTGAEVSRPDKFVRFQAIGCAASIRSATSSCSRHRCGSWMSSASSPFTVA